MSKYKSDIADSASNMMQLSGTLEGMLQDIHGQKEVSTSQEESIEIATPAVPPPTPVAPKKAKRQKQPVLSQAPAPTMVDGDELWTAFCTSVQKKTTCPK